MSARSVAKCPVLTPLLMFEGRAEEAIAVYTALGLMEGAPLIQRYGPGEGGAIGSLKLARITVAGQRLMLFDSPIPHAFSFTPAISLHLACAEEAEALRLFTRLAEAGQVLMPLQSYDFSPLFGWVSDRFGVSWQISLEEPEAAAAR